MALKLPPCPPLTAEGFSANTWQRWLDILQRKLAEAYGPGNEPPGNFAVPASAAAVGIVTQRVERLEIQLAIAPNPFPAIEALRRLSALSGTDVTFRNLTTTGPFTLYNGLLKSSGVTGLQFTGASTLANAQAFFENTDTDLIIHGSSSGAVVKTVKINASGSAATHLAVTSTGTTITGQLAITSKFGANGATPQAATALPAAAVDAATTLALANAIRTLLIANGLAS